MYWETELFQFLLSMLFSNHPWQSWAWKNERVACYSQMTEANLTKWGRLPEGSRDLTIISAQWLVRLTGSLHSLYGIQRTSTKGNRSSSTAHYWASLTNDRQKRDSIFFSLPDTSLNKAVTHVQQYWRLYLETIYRTRHGNYTCGAIWKCRIKRCFYIQYCIYIWYLLWVANHSL